MCRPLCGTRRSSWRIPVHANPKPHSGLFARSIHAEVEVRRRREFLPDAPAQFVGDRDVLRRSQPPLVHPEPEIGQGHLPFAHVGDFEPALKETLDLVQFARLDAA